MKDCVVRVGTEAYKRGNTYYYARTIRTLKNKTDYDILHEEVQSIGILDALDNIVNLQAVEDGVYNLIAFNISKDIESGYIDDWDLKLVPYAGE